MTSPSWFFRGAVKNDCERYPVPLSNFLVPKIEAVGFVGVGDVLGGASKGDVGGDVLVIGLPCFGIGHVEGGKRDLFAGGAAERDAEGNRCA